MSRPGRTPEEIEAHVNDNWPIFFGRARAGLEEMVSSGWEIRRRDEADKLNLPPQGEENT